jgi:hypothetical protein
VSGIKKELKAAYKHAETTNEKQNKVNKQRYYEKIHYSHLMPGDKSPDSEPRAERKAKVDRSLCLDAKCY